MRLFVGTLMNTKSWVQSSLHTSQIFFASLLNLIIFYHLSFLKKGSEFYETLNNCLESLQERVFSQCSVFSVLARGLSLALWLHYTTLYNGCKQDFCTICCTGLYRAVQGYTGLYKRLGASRSVQERLGASRSVYKDVQGCTSVQERLGASRSVYKDVQGCTGVQERLGALRIVIT